MNRVGIVLTLLLLPVTASAWTRASEERIARKAASLAPPDLRNLIEKFEGHYKAGLERGDTEEQTARHQQFGTGRLKEQIERETRSIITMIRGGQPMSQVVIRLGVLSHLVADANNPFHVSNADARLAGSKSDFETFFEKRMGKFPTVFYGLTEPFRLTSFLDGTIQRTSSYYPLMSEEYFRYGQRRTHADFDDRSTAFGIASLCYSHAVTDLVNLYYHIWGEAGGDVRSASVMRGGNLLMNGGN
jgi:hypothetical protein